MSTARQSAAEWKAEGNARFAAREYVEAAAAYSRAIALEPEDAIFHSNRCACHLKLGQLDAALADALRLRELRPAWAKSHFREGSVLAAMGRHADAARALCEALQLEQSAEAEALLRGEMAAAGLFDAAEHQLLLQRCLLLLDKKGPTRAQPGAERRPAVSGAWKRNVLPSDEGPRARAGATLSAVGSALWLIGGIDARAAPESAHAAVPSAADGSVHRLETAVGNRHARARVPRPFCISRPPPPSRPRDAPRPRPEPSAWVAEHTRAPDGPPPASRGGHGACVRGAEIWIFGGHTASGEALADLHALDTATAAWRRVEAAQPPAARHAHSLLHEPGPRDRLLLFGGADGSSAPLGDLHALSLGAAAGEAGEAPALRWEPVETRGSPPAPREMHAAALVPAAAAAPPQQARAEAEAGQGDGARAGAAAGAFGCGGGYLVIHGGRSAGTVLSDLWLLHLGARRAAPREPRPLPHRSPRRPRPLSPPALGRRHARLAVRREPARPLQPRAQPAPGPRGGRAGSARRLWRLRRALAARRHAAANAGRAAGRCRRGRDGMRGDVGRRQRRAQWRAEGALRARAGEHGARALRVRGRPRGGLHRGHQPACL